MMAYRYANIKNDLHGIVFKGRLAYAMRAWPKVSNHKLPRSARVRKPQIAGFLLFTLRFARKARHRRQPSFEPAKQIAEGAITVALWMGLPATGSSPMPRCELTSGMHSPSKTKPGFNWVEVR